MEENVRFYKCPICGNVIGLINGNMEHITCCGQPMELMKANSSDAATEKHVPSYEKIENEIVVKVGEIIHPMDEDHFIVWIAQVADHRTTRIRFTPGQLPQAIFPYIPGSTLYAYCNKHGLWKKDVE